MNTNENQPLRRSKRHPDPLRTGAASFKRVLGSSPPYPSALLSMLAYPLDDIFVAVTDFFRNRLPFTQCGAVLKYQLLSSVAFILVPSVTAELTSGRIAVDLRGAIWLDLDQQNVGKGHQLVRSGASPDRMLHAWGHGKRTH